LLKLRILKSNLYFKWKKNYYHLRLIVFFQVNIQLGGTSKNKLDEKTLKGTPTPMSIIALKLMPVFHSFSFAFSFK